MSECQVIIAVAMFLQSPSRPGGVDDRIWIMMVGCWSEDPRQRPAMRSIVSDLERFGMSVLPYHSKSMKKPDFMDTPSYLANSITTPASSITTYAMLSFLISIFYVGLCDEE